MEALDTSLMAHQRSAQADLDLDDIWFYVAKQGGSKELAERLIDFITDRPPVPRSRSSRQRERDLPSS